ncbi:unnamed protein product [Calicophoron daubneyi]|uniref:Uncharacterized protein n=1 Tax=Calicophoron daubneyi TaxID=300641 RepID=A0AAV2TEY2_CALDB
MSLFLVNKSKSGLDGGSELSAAEVEELKSFQPTPEESRRAVRISMFYLLVALVIGVSVWFKTIETYRAPLPFLEIRKLGSRPINIEAVPPIRINLTGLNHIKKKIEESQEAALFRELLLERDKRSQRQKSRRSRMALILSGRIHHFRGIVIK